MWEKAGGVDMHSFCFVMPFQGLSRQSAGEMAESMRIILSSQYVLNDLRKEGRS